MVRICAILCFISFVIAPLLPVAQTVQYAKGTVRFEDKDNITIAGTFNNTLHVLKENAWGAIEVLLYNSDLALMDRKPIQSEKEGYAAIEVLPYHNFYYVLLRYGKDGKYKFLKVDASGKFQDETELIKEKFSTALIKDNQPQNITKVQDRLLFVNHYFDQSRQKLFVRTLSSDSLFSNQNQRLIILDYKFGADIISNILFTDTSTAYLVRSFRNLSPNRGQVDIIRYNLITENSTQINLANNDDNFSDPDLNFDSVDSSFFLVAKLTAKRASNGEGDFKRYYYVKLNKALEEISPSMMVKIKSSNERVLLIPRSATAFILDNTGQFKFYQNPSSMIGPSYAYWGPTENVIFPAPSQSAPYVTSQLPQPDPRPAKIPARFDPNLKRTDVDMRVISLTGAVGKKDVLLKSRKGKFRSQYYNCFMFSDSNSNALFFTNKYSLYRSGISYVTISNEKFSDEEFLKVDQKFEYILPLAKKISNQSFVIPYAFKNQLGLVRVDL